MHKKIKNIFLDRDGTIIEEKHYLCDPAQVKLLSGVLTTLQNMQAAGLKLFLVTNQSGIGRGYFDLQQYFKVQTELEQQLKDVKLTDTKFCPHQPRDNCSCRKPGPGMWQELSKKHELRPEQSIMIGDKSADVLFGRQNGFALSALVLTGHGREEIQKMGLKIDLHQVTELTYNHNFPDVIAPSIDKLYGWLIKRDIL